MKPFLHPFTIVASLLLAASLAYGQADKQVLWKIVDKNGKVTYVDKEPPKDFEGQVTRVEVDLAGNRAASPKAGTPSAPGAPPASPTSDVKRASADAELERALERLEAAKKALESGKEPTEAEIRWIGKKGGGARPEPTQGYEERVRMLEDAVKSAEAEVERARNAVR